VTRRTIGLGPMVIDVARRTRHDRNPRRQWRVALPAGLRRVRCVIEEQIAPSRRIPDGQIHHGRRHPLRRKSGRTVAARAFVTARRVVVTGRTILRDPDTSHPVLLRGTVAATARERFVFVVLKGAALLRRCRDGGERDRGECDNPDSDARRARKSRPAAALRWHPLSESAARPIGRWRVPPARQQAQRRVRALVKHPPWARQPPRGGPDPKRRLPRECRAD